MNEPSNLAVALVAVTVPRWVVVVAAGLVGLVIGSFLNVVVYRTPRHLSVVQPGSFCPTCSTPVRPVDNIPMLSWLVLRGRCRFCGAPISARYPLVEGGTGVVFALVGAAVGPHWAVLGLCALAGTVAALTAIELDGERPPLSVACWGSAIGVIGLLGAAASNGHWARFVGSAVGLVVAAALGFLLHRTAGAAGGIPVARGAWALLPTGAVLGWSGPVGSAVGAGVLGALLLLAVRAGSRSRVDAAPGRHAVTPSIGPAVAAGLSAVLGVVAAVAAGATLA